MKFKIRRHVLIDAHNELEVDVPQDVANPSLTILAVGDRVHAVSSWVELTEEEKKNLKAQQARQDLGLLPAR